MIDLLLAAVLLGLASFRAWRIVATDQITEPLRVRLLMAEGRFWTFVSDLTFCPWCLGWWIAGAGAAGLAVTAGWSPLEFALVWLAASAVCGLVAKQDDNEE